MANPPLNDRNENSEPSGLLPHDYDRSAKHPIMVGPMLTWLMVPPLQTSVNFKTHIILCFMWEDIKFVFGFKRHLTEMSLCANTRNKESSLPLVVAPFTKIMPL